MLPCEHSTHERLPPLLSVYSLAGYIIWSFYRTTVGSTCIVKKADEMKVFIFFRFYPPIASISTHFSRYRATAIGIAVAGSSVGLSSISYHFFVNSYHYTRRGCLSDYSPTIVRTLRIWLGCPHFRLRKWCSVYCRHHDGF